MYRKFNVTENLLFAQRIFQEFREIRPRSSFVFETGSFTVRHAMALACATKRTIGTEQQTAAGRGGTNIPEEDRKSWQHRAP